MCIITGAIVFKMEPNCHNGYTYTGYQWIMENKHKAAQRKKPAEFGDCRRTKSLPAGWSKPKTPTVSTRSYH